MHPILEDETSRQILARHVGVDATSCFVVATLGWRARHVAQDFIDAIFGKRKNAMPLAYEGRMFTYQPEAQRVTLFFLAYQLKNTYDTIVWDDGIIFIIHHVLTLFTIVSSLYRPQTRAWERHTGKAEHLPTHFRFIFFKVGGNARTRSFLLSVLLWSF